MKTCLLLVTTIVMAVGCQQPAMRSVSTAPDVSQAEQLAEEIARVLPEGWHQIYAGVDSAPRRWSGKTEAVTVAFQHDSLKFSDDHRTRALFQLWRTPIAYCGEPLPTQFLQPGGAWVFGSSKDYRWFIEGFLPEEADWRPVRTAIMKRFAFMPPG